MEAPEVALDAVLSNDNKVATTFWTTNNGEVALLDGLKPSDFAYNSVSLLLKTETVFRLYIKTTNISKYNVVVDYDITDNESMLDYFYEDRNKGAVVKTWTRAEESDLYYVEITGIPASDFDKKFAITVEDTETFNKCTYVCNVYSYMRTMFRRDNPNDVYQTQINTLLRYMYVYHMKAVAYNSVHAKGDA